MSVSVNVSTRSLLDHELPAMIRGKLDRFQLDLAASTLQLEITESRIIADLRRARTRSRSCARWA